jgi:hypothetical protein
MPAFFVLVGIGLEQFGQIGSRILYQVLRKKELKNNSLIHNTNALSLVFIGLLIIGHLVWIDATHYPFEPGYYNAYVGGTKTIARKELFDADYWGSGVQQAMEFIKNTHKGKANVYTCQLLHLARFYGNDDVKAVSDGNLAQYVIVPNSPSYFGGPIQFHKTYDTLVYTVERAGAPMFYVFKRKAPTFWSCGPETESVYID